MIGVGIPFTGNLSCPIPTQIKVSQGAAISSLRSDDTNIYWIESGTSIKKMSVNGGSVTTLVSSRTPQGIRVANSAVYWTDQDDTINSVSTAGGGTTQIQLNFGSNQGNFRVDATKIFLRSGLSITISGGTVATVFTATTAQGTIAIDSTHVFWSEVTFPGNLKQVAKTGGAVTTLVNSALPPPFWLEADGTNVYWATHGAFGGPLSLNKQLVGSTSVTFLASAFIQGPITVDSNFIYYHNDGNGSIAKIKIAGGNVNSPVANISPYQTMNNGTEVVLDSNSIYWVNFDNSIWKMDKCTTVPV